MCVCVCVCVCVCDLLYNVHVCTVHAVSVCMWCVYNTCNVLLMTVKAHVL